MQVSFWRTRKKTEGEMATVRFRWVYFLSLLIALAHAASGGEIKLQDKLSGVTLGSIRSIRIGNHVFISIEDFASALSIPTESNRTTKKITLFYKQNKITFSAYTPFAQMGEVRIQMSTEVLFPNGDFYVPLHDMIKGLDFADINTLSFDKSSQILSIVMRPPNITQISTDAHDDTLRLFVHTLQKFQQKNIDTIQDKEWVYVNIKGGVIDISKDWKKPDETQLFELIPSQISINKARLALHIAPNVTLGKVAAIPEKHEIEIILVSSGGASSAVFAELKQEREKWRIDTIIIDPGHGGKDAGCSASGNLEKNIALKIAKQVKNELARRTTGKIILTRDHDTFVPLKGRTKKANQAGGKLFVSIHVDANRVRSIHGHTVYFLGPAKTEQARDVAHFENSVIKFEDSQNDYAGFSDASFILAANAQNSYNKESQDLASIIDNKLQSECGSHSIGVRQAGFYVLYGASMPNILVETGFITNSSDRKKLSTSSYQSRLAKAIADGVIQFKNQYEKMTL